MKSSETRFLADAFSHIYVEEQAFSYEITDRILNKFSNSHIISIKHYKDVFNRGNQDFMLQKSSQALILAVNNGELIYPGARVCQSFGNEYFYYTPEIMNCIYDCEYCYLQGMYPSSNLVIFVNIDDYFKKISEILKQHPAYVCISYDTDIPALEGITGIAEKWIDFTRKNNNLTIEIRTKSAYMLHVSDSSSNDRVIYAWTLSPEEIISAYEHKTPSLSSRLKAVRAAAEAGYRVRLCFDPLIYVKNYRMIYSAFFHDVFASVNSELIQDVSLGLFRIPAGYMKQMRKKRTCAITAYPYTTTGGVCSYDEKKSGEMLAFAESELKKYIDSSKIYTV